MIDTHCHIQFKSFDNDRETVIRRCVEKNVVMNAVGTQIDTSRKAVELAEKYENIYATVGLHPIQEDVVEVKEEGTKFTSRGEKFDPKLYEELLKSKKVIAVGETGLDAYHVPKDKDFAEVMEAQWKLFLQHAKLAVANKLPLVIHVRDAHEEMIERLKDWKIDAIGVFHCFSGDWSYAQEYLKLGFYLGFTGVVTFPPKKTDPKPQLDLLEVIEKMPLDRLLVETDAPYLAPQKYRGERCEPWMVEEVIKKIAEIRGVSVLEIEEISSANARKLFTRIS
jgi:TatD DNase family protein